METIFCTAAKALGQIACQKMMNDVFKEEDITPKKIASNKKVTAPTEVRWTRWTKVYTDTFKTSFKDLNVEPDDKEFDKLKKEFVKYLTDLTEEDYCKDTKSHPDRMKDFAMLKTPKKVDVKEDTVVKNSVKKKKTMWDEMNGRESPDGPPSNAANIHTVSDIEQLTNNELLLEVDGSPEGVFWDGKNGHWIRGPPAVDDEDLVEQVFENVAYEIGEESSRIYEFNKDKDRHEFVGYMGVGKFSEMKFD